MITYTSDDGVFAASVSFDRYDGDRIRWNYEVKANGDTVAKGSDLSTPSFDILGALDTLQTFMSAFIESAQYPDGENRDLFPDTLLPFGEYIEGMGLELLTDSEGE